LTHEEKKTVHEDGLVNAFIHRCPTLDIAGYELLEDGDGAPDCRLIVGSKEIGLDVTTYVREDELKLEKACEQFLEKSARQVRLALPTVVLDVQVVWLPQLLVSRLKAGRGQQELVEFVIHRIPSLNELVSYAHDDLPPILQELFDEIQIHHCSSNISSDWRYWTSSWLPDLTIEDVATTIQKKNPKLFRYRQYFEEVWLLICPQAGGASSLFNLPDELITNVYQTDFDRVYLMDVGCSTVHALETQSLNRQSAVLAQSNPRLSQFKSIK
jgi:hypothetical protein